MRDWAGVTGLAVVAAGVLGYHPYSEDGGIYVAEIKRALDPGLYPHGSEFVAGHLGFSGFTTTVVWMVRAGVRLDVAMLGLHLLCLWGLLVGVWQLSVRCCASEPARWAATGLVALCLTMPVAGTSLLLMDPYVTARSASLMLAVLGLGCLADFMVDRARWGRLGWGVAALAGAGMAHPLMGGYGMGAAAVLVCVLAKRRWVQVAGVLAVATGAGIVAGFGQAMGTTETMEYARVASTRYYWFLGQWRWYELIGLVGPLLILSWIGWGREARDVERGLARMGVWVGLIGLGISLAFVREGSRIHAVARMQPLRCFQVVYLVMLMVLGAWLGERLLRRSAWRWLLAGVSLGTVMIYVQRATYPASGYLELPGMRIANQWEEAFVWVRENTPKDALFGLDSDYVHRHGEDAQGFRAVAERSVLPDYSKDGGQAAIRPELTEAWAKGQKAQARLTVETDVERLRALRPAEVNWVVMGQEAVTAFTCPYENNLVKVCRLP